MDDSTFGLVIVPSEGRSLSEAEADLDEALAAFLETGVDSDALERIKMQIRASEIYANDSTQSLARRYGAALTSGLEIADVQEWPDILRAVTEEEIMAAAAEVFDLRKSVTAWLMRPQETNSEADQ